MSMTFRGDCIARTLANDSGTVLVNELYVSGADFVIPSASTHDMGNHW